VLQHLSNAEISRVLGNCRHYSLILVTEHLPIGCDIIPNKDKPHGPDTRLCDASGVFLGEPPFSLAIEIMLELPFDCGGVLRTVLIHDNKSLSAGNCLESQQ
jgi:hypothetical protein